MYGVNARRLRRRVIVLAVFGIAPILPALLLLYWSQSPGAALRSSEQVTYALVLTGAAFTYFHWRMSAATMEHPTSTRLAGWLTAGLVLTALQGLAQAAMVNPVPPQWRDAWPLVSELTLILVLLAGVLASDRAEVPGDPAIMGSVGALVLTAVGFITVHVVPPLQLTHTVGRLIVTLLMVLGLLFALAVMQRHPGAHWASRRLGLVVVLMTFARCVGYLAMHNRPGLGVAIFANLAAAVLICTMSQALLRRSLTQHHRELIELERTLAEARADVLHERELLHEVGSTVAGLSSATQVMKQGRLISGERRARLEQLMDAEVARLERLIRTRGALVEEGLDLPLEQSDAEVDFDVDEVVETLVLSHQSRGLDVRWQASGLRAAGDPDELAEVVNILLENARRHGGRTVWLEARHHDGFVELACSDDGPGVPAELRPHLFTSGVRGPDSPGQGLGLSIARRHLSRRGGSLELGPSLRSGATFVARLKNSELADAHHVA